MPRMIYIEVCNFSKKINTKMVGISQVQLRRIDF